MIDALIAGKLHGAPSQRTAKTGKPFTTCKVRVPTGEDGVFCHVIAFDQEAQAGLMALGSGEAVALAGSLKVSVWTDKEGTARPSLDLVASKLLTAYSIAKKRRAMQPDQEAGKQQPRQYRRDDYADDPGERDGGEGIPF